MKIVLIHGFKANSSSNFFPWLKDELRRLGHEVVVPDLPNPESPDPEEWIKTLVETVGPVDEETIIVGHSLGAPTALRFLEAAEAYTTPRGCLLISPPWMIRSEDLRGFFLSELDFDVLMWKASQFVVVHDKQDTIIPFDHAQKYADVLHAKLIATEGNGHFQGGEYPILLDTLKDMISKEIVFDPGEGLDNQYADIA